MTVIWATRGRTWGFRFLRASVPGDPLPTYEEAFAGLEAEPEVFRRLDGGRVALRFQDPAGRKDMAGRVIPHDFVVLPPFADEINSVADGLERVWPAFEAEFADVWELPRPPQRRL